MKRSLTRMLDMDFEHISEQPINLFIERKYQMQNVTFVKDLTPYMWNVQIPKEMITSFN